MNRIRINVLTEFTETSNLEINSFIENLKESFENVSILSIESLPGNYSKFYSFKYRVKFYHDLYLVI